jgi:hypothetical protein
MFCLPLSVRRRGSDILKAGNDCFAEKYIYWANCIGIFTDGAANLRVHTKGFKVKASNVNFMYFIIHREVSVCVCVRAFVRVWASMSFIGASAVCCFRISTLEKIIKADCVTERCMVDLHAHVRWVGHRTTDNMKNNHTQCCIEALSVGFGIKLFYSRKVTVLYKT